METRRIPAGSSLSYSLRTADAWSVANLVRKTEHRRHARQPINGKVRVLWEGADGRSQVYMAELVDISPKGMKIRVDLKMDPRTYVTVNDPGIGVTGRGSVRYCTYEKGKYAVGLEFSGGTGWKPAAEPEAALSMKSE